MHRSTRPRSSRKLGRLTNGIITGIADFTYLRDGLLYVEDMSGAGHTCFSSRIHTWAEATWLDKCDLWAEQLVGAYKIFQTRKSSSREALEDFMAAKKMFDRFAVAAGNAKPKAASKLIECLKRPTLTKFVEDCGVRPLIDETLNAGGAKLFILRGQFAGELRRRQELFLAFRSEVKNIEFRARCSAVELPVPRRKAPGFEVT